MNAEPAVEPELVTSWALTGHLTDDMRTEMVEGRAMRIGTARCDQSITVYDEPTLRAYWRRARRHLDDLDRPRTACRRCFPADREILRRQNPTAQ